MLKHECTYICVGICSFWLCTVLHVYMYDFIHYSILQQVASNTTCILLYVRACGHHMYLYKYVGAQAPLPYPHLYLLHNKYAQLLLLQLSSTVTAASVLSVVCFYWQQWVLVLVREYGEARCPISLVGITPVAYLGPESVKLLGLPETIDSPDCL